MTKQTVDVTLEESDWIHALEDKTVGEAIQWLSDYQRNYTLTVEWDWDAKTGAITYERFETDDEESVREAAEAKVIADREYQAEWTRLRRIADAEYLVKSKSATDVSLSIYLQKHKDNAKIDDLKNLFIALVQLERDGHPDCGAAMREVRGCMELLEKQ